MGSIIPTTYRLVILAMIGLYLTALLALFLWTAGQVLFQPAVYQQVLREQDAYASYPVWFGELLILSGDRILPGSSAGILGLLETSRYQRVVREVFPQDWVQEQVEGLIDQYWAYFNFQTDRLTLLVDLRPIRGRLQGSDAPQIASIIAQGLPPCSMEELFDYVLRALTGQAEGLPLCRPSQELVGLANLLVGGLLDGIAAAIPDQVDLASLGRVPLALTGERLAATWQGWFAAYRIFRQAGPWLPWLALLFLLLVAVAGYRTRRGSLFWTGAGLLLPGASGLLIVLLLSLWVRQAMPVLIQGIFGSLAIGGLIVNLLVEVGRQYLSKAAWIAGGLALAGTAMMAASIYRARKDLT